MTTPLEIPEWTLGDRMNKALKHAGLTHQEMAEHLGVNPSTMRTWTSGVTRPRAGMLRQWALRSGVPYEWLISGVVSVSGNTPPPVDTEPTVTQASARRRKFVAATHMAAPVRGRKAGGSVQAA